MSAHVCLICLAQGHCTVGNNALSSEIECAEGQLLSDLFGILLLLKPEAAYR